MASVFSKVRELLRHNKIHVIIYKIVYDMKITTMMHKSRAFVHK